MLRIPASKSGVKQRKATHRPVKTKKGRPLHIPAHRDRLFRFIVTDFGCLPGIVGHDAGIIGHVPPESQPTHWNS